MCFIKHVHRKGFFLPDDVLKYERRTAENNIVVYKVILESRFLFIKLYFSAVRNFKYKKGKQYETEIDIECLYWSRTSDGVYDYRVCATSGFYSFAKKFIPIYGDPYVLAEFIIPKGAVYYFDETAGIYISDKIIFNKVIKVHN